MKKYVVLCVTFVLGVVLTVQFLWFLGYHHKASIAEAKVNVSSAEGEITYMNQKRVRRRKKPAKIVNEVEAYIVKLEDTRRVNVSDADYAKLSVGDTITVYWHNDNPKSLYLSAESAGGNEPRLAAFMILSIFLFITGLGLDVFSIILFSALRSQAKARGRES